MKLYSDIHGPHKINLTHSFNFILKSVAMCTQNQGSHLWFWVKYPDNHWLDYWEFFSDMHGPLRMNPPDFGGPLTFGLMSPAKVEPVFQLSSEMFQKPLEELPHNVVQTFMVLRFIVNFNLPNSISLIWSAPKYWEHIGKCYHERT